MASTKTSPSGPIPFRIVEQAPSVSDYQRLCRSAGWHTHDDTSVAKGLAASLFAVTAVMDGETVGMARVVGDGSVYFYVQDVIVDPEHQSLGIGRALMDAVMNWLGRNAPAGAFIGLMAARGQALFYEPYGFKPRPEDAPGMFYHQPAAPAPPRPRPSGRSG